MVRRREAAATTDELAAELERTRRLLDEMTRQAERNERILRRTQQRELRLLQAEDLDHLFDEMLTGLAESYGLDAVTVVICDGGHDIRHLLAAGGSDAEALHGLILVDTLAGLTPHHVALRKPWLGPYRAADHALAFPGAAALGSIALIPLRHKRHLFGSINFGSRDPERFTAAHATDFFAHLGVIASFAIENVVNRARLTQSGFTDVLTGAYNRRYLQVRLGEELAAARRRGTAVTCLMLDIDHFKQVNDTWGHAAGDAVLREVASRIDAEVRASDVAARYGGEEFVVLLPETCAQDGRRLAERIRKAIAATAFEIGKGRTIDVTASIGIASAAPQRGNSDLKTLGDGMLARADVALYEAKAAGRNTVATDPDTGR